MTDLTYRQVSTSPFKMAVVLDRKVVGHIRRPAPDRYFYQPKGQTSIKGDFFDTLEAVKESLEQ